MKNYICKQCKNKEVAEVDKEVKKCSSCGGESFDVWTSEFRNKSEWVNEPKHETEWKNQEKH